MKKSKPRKNRRLWLAKLRTKFPHSRDSFLCDLCALRVLCVEVFPKRFNTESTEVTEKSVQPRTDCRCEGAKLIARQNVEGRLWRRQFRNSAGTFDSTNRCVPLRYIQTPGLVSLPDCGDGWRYGWPVMTQHGDIRASPQCFNGGFARAIPPRNRAHAEIISENHAAEFHAAAQHAVKHLPRKRNGPLRINLGQQNVRGHHQWHASRDGRCEGNKFGGLETFHRPGEYRQVVVWVDQRIAMPGEMLRAGEHSARAQTLIECHAHLCDKLRIGAKTAVLRDGAFRIYVEVQHRREIEIASGGAEFDRHRPRHLFHQGDVTRAAEFRR